MKYAFSFALTLLLAACSGNTVRDTLGLNNNAPDEFRVVSRPSLSVPDEFYLYPPGSATGNDRAATATGDARDALFGSDGDAAYLDKYANAVKAPSSASTTVAPVRSAALASPAETRLLQRLGAGNADGDIRRKLRNDGNAVQQERGWLEPEPSEPVVNAAAERERLQDNAKAGKPVNAGDVPEIVQQDSIWDRLF